MARTAMRDLTTFRTLGAVALAAAGLAACSHSSAQNAAAARTTSTTTTSSSTTTTSTTAKPTTTTGKPTPGLGVGAKGPQVQALEEKLGAMHYDAGKVDGVFDSVLSSAVMAFQKVNGMARTGRATDDVVAAIQGGSAPAAMVPGGGADKVEVDLKRQVLFLWQGGSLVRILPVSTGNGKRYCVDGQCAYAVTSGGSFRIGWKILGDHVSRLGHLYNPLFFDGGIAIHGSPSVPAYPASHGCVRIPMFASLWFYKTVPKGTPVYVVGGPKAPVPFDERAPNETTTTTSTSSSTTTSSTTSSTTTTLTTTTTTIPATTSTTI